MGKSGREIMADGMREVGPVGSDSGRPPGSELGPVSRRDRFVRWVFLNNYEESPVTIRLVQVGACMKSIGPAITGMALHG